MDATKTAGVILFRTSRVIGYESRDKWYRDDIFREINISDTDTFIAADDTHTLTLGSHPPIAIHYIDRAGLLKLPTPYEAGHPGNRREFAKTVAKALGLKVLDEGEARDWVEKHSSGRLSLWKTARSFARACNGRWSLYVVRDLVRGIRAAQKKSARPKPTKEVVSREVMISKFADRPHWLMYCSVRMASGEIVRTKYRSTKSTTKDGAEAAAAVWQRLLDDSREGELDSALRKLIGERRREMRRANAALSLQSLRSDLKTLVETNA